jgi:transposase
MAVLSCHPEEASVEQVTPIGLDIAKHVFQAHGADHTGKTIFSKRLTRTKLIAFFTAQPPCIVANGSLRRRSLLGT